MTGGEVAHPEPSKEPHEPEVITPERIADEVALRVESFTYRRGPLPDSEELAAYGEINATFPDRIMRMAELEQQTRHELQRRGADYADRQLADTADLTRRGQDRALTVALSFLVATVLVMVLGIVNGSGTAIITGGVLGSIDLAALVGLFIYRVRTETDDE